MIVMVLYTYNKLIGGILMKKSILVLLLIVSIFSSFMVVNANIPPDNGCPECGSLDMSGYGYSYSQAVGTIPCSHHLGYTDTIYNKYSYSVTICNECGYEHYTEPVITATYIVCGYDGSIYYQ